MRPICSQLCGQVSQASSAIEHLLELGMQFDKVDHKPHLTQEGGHSSRRVLHVADATGKAVTDELVEHGHEHPNISFLNNRLAIDVVIQNNKFDTQRHVVSNYAYVPDDDVVEVLEANHIVLATGGANKVYLYTSNPDVSTGDGIAMA